MKRFITSVLGVLLLIGVLQAKTTVERYYDLPGMKQRVTKVHTVAQTELGNTSPETAVPSDRAMRKITPAAGEELVKVTVTFPNVGEGGEWMVPWGRMFIYNQEGYFQFQEVNPYDEEWNRIPKTELTFEVPKGTYDVLSPFDHVNPSHFFGCDPTVYYIAENIQAMKM